MFRVLIVGREEEVPNYVLALQETGLEPVIAMHLPTEKEGYTLNDFDGLLVPGGADVDPEFYHQENTGCRTIDKELDICQFAVARAFILAGKPILGICKGHQILNVCFGGTLIQDLENNVHHQSFQGKEEHHPTTSLDLPGNPLFALYGETQITNSSHHQAIDVPGKDLEILQYSDDRVIEAVRHTSLPVLAVQWHPERMAYTKYQEGCADGALIFRFFKEMIKAYKTFS